MIWLASSKEDLLALPQDVIKSFGHALHFAQKGGFHIHSKVLKGFSGSSVIEIKESDKSGTYRLVYTIKFPNVVFVLHAFQKKSKHGIKTPQKDVDLIKSRLKKAEELYRELVWR